MSLTLSHLMTALVYEEGGFGVDLVVKPYPTISVAYGGGEEGSWKRQNPGAEAPWWQSDRLTTLLEDDWESGTPTWVNVYFLSSLFSFMAWPILFVTFVVVKLVKYRRAKVVKL